MSKNKSFFLILSMFVLALILVACGNGDNETSNGSTNSNKQESNDDYPSKAISAIVPWAAGSGSDIAFRGYAEYLSDELGQNINVQNVTGGNGGVGWAEAAAAPNDGYNLALLTFDVLTNEILGVSDTSYKDFDIINMFTIQGMLLITHADYGYDSLEDFLDAAKEAKANGETLTIGTNGDYGVWHQAGMLMAEETGTDDAYNFVPLDGSSEQVSELLGKHLDAIVISPTPAIGHIEEGTLVGLGSFTEERIPVLPEVPTFQELGYDVLYESWRALAVPAGAPESVIERLSEASENAFNDPDFQEWAEETNIDPAYLNAEDAKKYLEDLFPVVETVIEKFDLD